ncbi:MAG: SulP family inorganic anion transporter [Actinomycetota bacterium]
MSLPREEPDRPDDSLLAREPRSLASVLPVTRWLPGYRWGRDLVPDSIAGLALAALLIPESMGYAGVAGVPPEVGLYAALGAVVAYVITGGTSILVVGPASAVAALSASIVAEFPSDVDPIGLTAGLALTSGVLLLLAGALRLGWIVNFISRPVLHAFVAGLSISIIVGQLDGLFGVEVEGESAVAKFLDVLRHLVDAHGLTTLIGVAAVAAILLLERVAERVPAALVVVVVGILAVVAFDLSAEGVEIVGDIPQGLPDVGIPDLSGMRWLELLAGGAALLLVGYSEGYAAASAVAASTDEDIDADQELIGSGAANVGAGLLGGLAVGGSLSKSAAAEAAGARTQVANLVAGVLVLATLLFLGPVFERLPEPVLAAVVIVAVLRSADPRRVLALWPVNRLDFAAGLITFVLVLVWETLPAMIVGVALSLAFLVRRASFPDVVELARDDAGVFRRAVDVDSPSGADDVAVLRFEAPLVYANADRLRTAADRLVERRSGTARLILDGEMISDLDTSGAEMLVDLDDELAANGVELQLARFHARARAQIARSHLAGRFADRTHARLEDAVAGSADLGDRDDRDDQGDI